MLSLNPRPSLKDIARSVGVSVNTASKVLNNTRSNTKVSEETRRRIVEAAKLLGYQPNSAARSLVHGRADVIAMYFETGLNLEAPYAVELVSGAEEGCQERRQSLLLYTKRSDQSLDDVCRMLLSGQADGIAMASWTSAEIISRMRDSYLPIVQFPSAHPDIPSLVIDESIGTRAAIRYLVSKGHKRIFYRGLPVDYIDAPRLADYRNACIDVGAELWVARASNLNGHIGDDEARLLALPRERRPTAAVCWNDEYAHRLLMYCDDVGLKVPDDLAVIGFDGARTFPPLKRRLTTVFVPWRSIAHQAIAMLVDIRDGTAIPDRVDFPLDLQIGDTA